MYFPDGKKTFRKMDILNNFKSNDSIKIYVFRVFLCSSLIIDLINSPTINCPCIILFYTQNVTFKTKKKEYEDNLWNRIYYSLKYHHIIYLPWSVFWWHQLLTNKYLDKYFHKVRWKVFFYLWQKDGCFYLVKIY